ncbi:MAG: V-type ATP synthase subunit K [Oscillospiraceae bacterium]|nr:V-type ATP synthase subunit K [Oscillospiraceae bacterium]
MELLSNFGGLGLAFLGGALAVGFSCAGSGKGTGCVGEAATGLLAEQPDAFGKCLIMQVLPGTQGLYGLVVWFMAMMQIGLFGGSGLVDLTLAQGFSVFSACIPMAIGGYITAVAQGRTAAASINLMAKNPDDWSRGIIMCVVVEFYAILSLLASILMLLQAV